MVLESTSPPRTTIDLLAPILERSGLKAGSGFHLGYSPERVLPGQILRELIENARVIGGIDPASAEAGRDLYATFVNGEIFLTDATTAEMVKLMENTYRDVNIAIANEFARLADRFGVDVWEAISLANRTRGSKSSTPARAWAAIASAWIPGSWWKLLRISPRSSALPAMSTTASRTLC